MKIINKINYSASIIILLSSLFISTIVWISQSDTINKEKEILLDDLHEQVDKRVKSNNEMLQFMFTNERRSISVATYVSSNVSIKKSLMNENFNSVNEELKAVCIQNNVDFIVLFDPNGKYFSSNNDEISHEIVEKHFKNLPHFYTFQDDFEDEETVEESKNVSSYEKWDKDILSGYKIDLQNKYGIVDIAVDIILGDNFNEVIGYVIVGNLISNRNKTIKNFWKMTANFSIITDIKTPISWVGINGQEKELEFALKSVVKNHTDHIDYDFILHGENYFTFRFELKNFFGELISYVYSGESSSDIYLQSNEIKDRAKKRQIKLQLILFLLTTVTFIVSVLIMRFIGRKIAAPIVKASAVAQNIAKGDLEHTLNDFTNDETGILSESINKMIASLRKLEKDNKLHLSNLKKESEISKQARIEADNANNSKSIFLANMSHEFRTPLNAILGFTSILSQEKELNNQSKEFLTSIDSSGKMLLKLINDILDISKAEAGKIIFEYKYTNFDSLIYEIETTFKKTMKDKGLNFIVNRNSEKLPKSIFTDEVRFKQILFNIISNAYKYTEKGYVKIEISSKIITDKTVNLYISIEDTGKGIAEDQIEKIFEEFVQHKDQNYSKYSGTGLGLAISKKLLNQMGGEIQLKSTLNEGSKFTVIFKELKISNIIESQNISIPVNDTSEKENIDIIDHSKNEFLLLELSSDEKSEFVGIMNEELFPFWEEIIITQNIDQIKDFSNLIIKTGNRFNLKNLTTFGESTLNYAETINLEKLLPHLDLFSNIIKNIQKIEI